MGGGESSPEWRVIEVLGVPFLGRGMEWSRREVGGQAVAGGAPLTRRLLEEEATRWSFDDGEM
jgi:hypothetical protein